jgi:hypothetical protein
MNVKRKRIDQARNDAEMLPLALTGCSNSSTTKRSESIPTVGAGTSAADTGVLADVLSKSSIETGAGRRR